MWAAVPQFLDHGGRPGLRLESGVELRVPMAELRLLDLCPGYLGPFWRHARYSNLGAPPDRLDGQRRLDRIERPSATADPRRDENDLRWRRKLPAHAGCVLQYRILHSPPDAREP